MAAMEESIGTIMSSKVEVELARATIINKISSLEELRVALTSDTIRELVSFAELRLAARGIKGATDNDVGAELGKMFNENVYQGGRVSWDLFEGGNPKVVIAALQADGGGARFFGENGPGTLITKIMSSQRAALVARGKALIEANGGNFAAAQRGWMNGVDIASEDYAAGLAQRLQDLATIVVSDSIAYSGGGDDPVVEPEFDPF